jgi:uncharacterized membrane protein
MSLSLVWGSPRWLTVVAPLLGVALLTLAWSYARARTRRSVRILAAVLKAVAFTALALCLLEPLLAGSRPRRGANAFAVLVDNSQSLQVHDEGSTTTRGAWVRQALRKDAHWRTRLGQDFDVRPYVFDSHLRAVAGFDELAFDGTGSTLATSLSALARRFRGLPLAGVLVFTDGNRTDAGPLDLAGLPPVYPVPPPSRGAVKDIGVKAVSVSQTNFESAPVVLRADVSAVGYAGETVIARVLDEDHKEVAREEATANSDGSPLSFRFQFRPEAPGIHLYRVQACAAGDLTALKAAPEGPPPSGEQTVANNARLAVVDQGGGPYRVLYVGGRPNWEFKFLHRAVDEDKQVELVGLLRVAKRQPKFDFRNPRDRDTSPLFQGFDHPDAETAERFDQPVLVRLNVRDETELRDGFPKAADELYQYHAIILDDVESAFFTPDQLALLRNFVSHRGGGLLMLGGLDTFAEGQYDRTPVGEMLPVYLTGRAEPDARPRQYRLELTREGWLQPWVRTRKTEDDERQRLEAMPPFLTLSRVGKIKPGAAVLAEVRDAGDETSPALVAQPFGKGHVAALLIGDFWHWGMRRLDTDESDQDRAWRQTVRWLVSNVPGRLEVSVQPKEGAGAPAVTIAARVFDPEYRPLDNAKVALKVNLPGGESLDLNAEPDSREAGTYSATYVPKRPGGYRVMATATAPDGSPISRREAGWAAQPAADEFARLEPDREALETIADKTGGEVVDGGRLDAFVTSLSARDAPIREPWTSPLWHQPWYFLVAIVCLTAEWGLRRIHGLA